MTFDRVIQSRAWDVTYSKGVRGDIILDVDSIKRCLISAIHLGVIIVKIKSAQWTHGFITIIR